METQETPEKTKNDIRNEIRSKIDAVLSNQNGEIRSLLSEKYVPLIEQAEKLKLELQASVTGKYSSELCELRTQLSKIESQIEQDKIEVSKTLWYPHGTKVYLWEKPRYAKEFHKTKTTGVVQIYDGTQELSSVIGTWNRPKKGDILVMINKKDGSMGVKYDKISDYGSIKTYAPFWLPEGETPTNNKFNKK